MTAVSAFTIEQTENSVDIHAWAIHVRGGDPRDVDTWMEFQEKGVKDRAAIDMFLIKRLQAMSLPLPWGRYTCESAIVRGDAKLLIWLRDTYHNNPPCPWGERACRLACEYDRYNMLVWMRTRDPPCSWGEFRELAWL